MNISESLKFISTTSNFAKVYAYQINDLINFEKILTDIRPFVKYNLVCVVDSSDLKNIDLSLLGKILQQKVDTVILTEKNSKDIYKNCKKASITSNIKVAIDEVIDTSREWDTIIICSSNINRIKEEIHKKFLPYSMKLSKLLYETLNIANIEESDRDINFISSDSNIINPNTLFVGIKGFVQNGAKYSYAAIQKGAVALVVDKDYIFDQKTQDLIKEKSIVVARTSDTRLVFSNLVYNFYGKAQPENICAVTGTSGKSSVVDFVRQIWGLLKIPTISLGTIGIVAENVYTSKKTLKSTDADYTTPVNGEVYKFLRYFKDKGVKHAAVEISSHGLEQYRLANIKVKAAGFTNLGTDHLDFYNGDSKAYLNAKAKLFKENLNEDGTAILNADIEEFDYLKDICESRGIKVFSYGKNGKDLKIISQILSLEGQIVEIEIFGKSYNLNLQILTSFQLHNLLCAVGLVFSASDFDIEKIISVLPQVKNAPGRLEYIGKTKKGSLVYVDFAYKGDALENTLKNLRSMLDKDKKIINVFGTCGDTCEWKTRRFELGNVSYNFADISILTDDSPRTEDPKKIRREIMQYCPNAIEISTGRKDAIKKAMELGGEGDIILVAGKGHEDYFTLGTENIPYTDQGTIIDLFNEGY